jgi:hypothetical protein
MDPFSALSAAASVVQFLDYGIRVMSKSRELYTAVDGALSANVEIEEASARLQGLSRALSLQGSLDETDAALDTICKECIVVSKDFISALEKLKVPDGEKHKKWQSFRLALKSVLGKEKIDEMADRLAKLRSELDTHVLVSVR